MRIEVPRDRNGSCEPILIAKCERRYPGFDNKTIAMYARSITVREIQDFLAEQYRTDVSPGVHQLGNLNAGLGLLQDLSHLLSFK